MCRWIFLARRWPNGSENASAKDGKDVSGWGRGDERNNTKLIFLLLLWLSAAVMHLTDVAVVWCGGEAKKERWPRINCKNASHSYENIYASCSERRTSNIIKARRSCVYIIIICVYIYTHEEVCESITHYIHYVLARLEWKSGQKNSRYLFSYVWKNKSITQS